MLKEAGGVLDYLHNTLNKR